MNSTYDMLIGSGVKLGSGMGALERLAGRNPIDLTATVKTGGVRDMLPDSGRRPIRKRNSDIVELPGANYLGMKK